MSVSLGKVTTFFIRRCGVGGTLTLGESDINYWRRIACDRWAFMTPWC